jgi:hypothetical protein
MAYVAYALMPLDATTARGPRTPVEVLVSPILHIICTVGSILATAVLFQDVTYVKRAEGKTGTLFLPCYRSSVHNFRKSLEGKESPKKGA